jgi:hypothetical protein
MFFPLYLVFHFHAEASNQLREPILAATNYAPDLSDLTS